jgi:hypothetical protein
VAWLCQVYHFYPLSPQPSSTSRFYVLNDWQDTFSTEQGVAPLPAAKISDIMLKTMGILKVCGSDGRTLEP